MKGNHLKIVDHNSLMDYAVQQLYYMTPGHSLSHPLSLARLNCIISTLFKPPISIFYSHSQLIILHFISLRNQKHLYGNSIIFPLPNPLTFICIYIFYFPVGYIAGSILLLTRTFPQTLHPFASHILKMLAPTVIASLSYILISSSPFHHTYMQLNILQYFFSFKMPSSDSRSFFQLLLHCSAPCVYKLPRRFVLCTLSPHPFSPFSLLPISLGFCPHHCLNTIFVQVPIPWMGFWGWGILGFEFMDT